MIQTNGKQEKKIKRPTINIKEEKKNVVFVVCSDRDEMFVSMVFYVRIKMDLRISFIINAYRNINNYQKYKEIELKNLNSII